MRACGIICHMKAFLFCALLLATNIQSMDSLTGMLKQECNKSDSSTIEGMPHDVRQYSFRISGRRNKEYFIKIDPQYIDEAMDTEKETLRYLLYNGRSVKATVYKCDEEYYVDVLKKGHKR